LYEAIPNGELNRLLAELAQRHPVATDFGPREPVERAAQGMLALMGGKQVFTPASHDDIQRYRRDHEMWLKTCESMLRDLHVMLQRRDGPPTFIFAATNRGTRPANDALVIIKAMGRFKISPPPYRSSGHDQTETPVELPGPPSAPHGSWKNRYPGQLAGFEGFEELFTRTASAQLLTGQAEAITPRLRDHLAPLPKARDPNGFFYKPSRPSSPVSEFALECEQWRHGVEAEDFIGEIHFIDEAGEISGALECTVHAQNLSDAASKRIPIRVTLRRALVNEMAWRLITQLG
jgi:hypothetical protein